MPSAPDIAPALPPGCVDFNKLHEACAKGHEDPVSIAMIVTDPAPDAAAEEPAPTTAPTITTAPAKSAKAE